MFHVSFGVSLNVSCEHPIGACVMFVGMPILMSGVMSILMSLFVSSENNRVSS